MRIQNRIKGLCVILAVALAGPLSTLVWGAAFNPGDALLISVSN